MIKFLLLCLFPLLTLQAAFKTKLLLNDNIILREGPGVFYNKIEILTKKEEVTILKTENEWVNIKTKSAKEGWIPSKAFKEEKINRELFKLSPGDEKLKLSSADATASIRGFLEFTSKCGTQLSKETEAKVTEDITFLYKNRGKDYIAFKRDSGPSKRNIEKEETPKELMDSATELFLGKAGLNFFLLNNKILKNDSLQLYVNIIARNLADNTAYYDREILVVILDSGDAGAFSIPGGIIFITKGLLKILKNEDHLAAVLSHELAHITRYHGLKMVSSELGSMKSRAEKAMGDAFDKEFSRSKNIEGKEKLKKIESEVCGIILEGNKYSQTARAKEDEFEADRFGTLYLYKSGYNPNAMIDVVTMLSEYKGGNLISVQHPATEERMKKIKSAMEDQALKKFGSNYFETSYKSWVLANL